MPKPGAREYLSPFLSLNSGLVLSQDLEKDTMGEIVEFVRGEIYSLALKFCLIPDQNN